MKKRITFIIIVLVIMLASIFLFSKGKTEEQSLKSTNRSSGGSKTIEKVENNPAMTTNSAEKVVDRDKFKSMEGSIAAGRYHTAALKSDGTVVAVGDNSYGQLNVSDWTDIVSVAAGDGFTAGLKSNGTVIVAGDKFYGWKRSSKWTGIVSLTVTDENTMIGIKSDGTIVAVSSSGYGVNAEKRKILSSGEIRSAAVAIEYMVAVKTNGTVQSFGPSRYGETEVEEFRDIVSIDAENFTTAGLKTDGTVVFTGVNKSNWEEAKSWTDIVSISVGTWHIVGLKSDGTVVAAGATNEYGQTKVSDWTDIVAVSAGAYHTVGLKADGTVVSTRVSPDTKLELKDWNNITSIACGLSHLVGLRSDGTGVAVGIIWDINNELAMDAWTGLIAITDWEGIKPDGTVVPIVKSEDPYIDKSKLKEAKSVQSKGTEKDSIRTIWVRDGYQLELKQDGTINLTGPNKHILNQITNWKDVTDISSSENLIAGLKSDGTVVLEVWHNFGQADVEDWENIGYR